jgi:membrane protease YdiL (CAAX protease family)
MAWTVLVILLLLRIPYTIFIIYFLPIENQIGAAIYEISTYSLTAFLIWWERERLADFNIDTPALFLIIFFHPIQTLILNYWKVESPLALPRPLGWLLWIISIGLLIALLKSGFKPLRLSTRSLTWIAIGLFLGLGISVLENARPFFAALGSSNTSVSFKSVISSAPVLLYHIGFAPINEEPLFRGFLWGYLRQQKWKVGWILVFQAVLFTCAHVYFASHYPLMFWLFIPGAAILLGVLTWRARSIAPAIITHGLINGSVYVLLLNFLALLR